MVRLPATVSTGAIFAGRYLMGPVLSAGGMAAVYEATHAYTKKRVAIKLMLPDVDADATMRSDFEREMSVTAAIDCPHIVRVLDAGVDDETRTQFIVMERLEGENFAELLRRRTRLAPQEVVALLAQVALALDATHAAGIVHRDLKPENLFLTRRHGAPHVVVLDFGIAKVVARDARASRCLGTPLYMSPEQLALEDVAPAVDVYALGQIAFTMLVGREYWHADSRAGTDPINLAFAILKGTVAPATERAEAHGVSLPVAVDAWFARASARRPAERWGSASELVDALARALGVRDEDRVLPVPVYPPVAPPRPADPAEAVRVAVAKTAPAWVPDAPPPPPQPKRVEERSAVVPRATAPRATGVQPAPAWLSESAVAPVEDGTYERLIEVLAPFTGREAAHNDVRRAVAKVCGARPDPSMLEYVVEVVMTQVPRTCVSTRASICMTLVEFCEKERRLRAQRSSRPTRTNWTT